MGTRSRGKKHEKHYQKEQTGGMDKMASAAPPHKQESPVNISEIFVVIDTCAQLGGTPCNVIESLKKIYDYTRERTISPIDTAQGWREKTDLSAFEYRDIGEQNKYIKFMERWIDKDSDKNPDEYLVISTEICEHFLERLTEAVLPKTLSPLLEAIEIAEQLNTPFQLSVEEKSILLEKFFVENEVENKKQKRLEKSKNILAHDLTEEEKDQIVKEVWQTELKDIPAIINDPDAVCYHKGFREDLIREKDKLMALTCLLLQKYAPDDLDHVVGNYPKNLSSILFTKARDIKPDTTALFKDTQFLLGDEELYKRPEFIQALKMTSLWPWHLKKYLGQDILGSIKNIHQNTADDSYIKLCTRHLSHIAKKPDQTLLLLLTHDQLLARRLNDIKETTTNQMALTGGEMVQFSYNETVHAMKHYILESTYEYLFALIQDKKTLETDASMTLLDVLKNNVKIPPALSELLEENVHNTQALLDASIKDRQQYKVADSSHQSRVAFRQKLYPSSESYRA